MTIPPGAGPSGAANFPPGDWLVPPIMALGPAEELYRIHRSVDRPVFFGPGPGSPSTSRFDSPSGAFGVLYLGLRFEGAFVETLVRNPRLPMVRRSAIEERSCTILAVSRPMRLVKMYGEGLSQLGLDNSISTGPYGPCGKWADYFWSHPDQPDGIAYHSRHDPEQICLAIFERKGPKFHEIRTEPLAAMAKAVASTLDRYGKSLLEDA